MRLDLTPCASPATPPPATRCAPRCRCSPCRSASPPSSSSPPWATAPGATSSASSPRSAPTWSSCCPAAPGTGGFNPANAITTTPRDLTIDDAASLRRLPRSAGSRRSPSALGNQLRRPAARNHGRRLDRRLHPHPQFRTGPRPGPARRGLEPRLVGRRHRRQDREKNCSATSRPSAS
jgi:hypothetical protein